MIDWDNQPLGVVSDSELSRRLGVSIPSVRRARIRRGIPAAPRAAGWKHGVDWDDKPLGEVTDAALAASIGCSASTVRLARVARGISPRGRPAPGIDSDVQKMFGPGRASSVGGRTYS